MTQTPPNEPEGRVVPFRRRGSLFTFNRAPPSPVQDLEKFERTEGEDDYRHRMMMNAMAAGVIILLIAGGIWIANSHGDDAQEPGLRAVRQAQLQPAGRGARCAALA